MNLNTFNKLCDFIYDVSISLKSSKMYIFVLKY